MTVNGQPLSSVLWTTGGEAARAWDRLPVDLRSGGNTIVLEVPAVLRIDHQRVEATR